MTRLELRWTLIWIVLTFLGPARQPGVWVWMPADVQAQAQTPASAPAVTAPAPLVASPEEDARRWVFAHYMTCFFSSVEFYKQEIELAQRHGIDGFALNCGSWASLDPKTQQYVPEGYTQAAQRMYQAAQELGTGFKLFLSPDLNGLGNVNKIEDMVRRFYTHPNQFRRGRQVVLSAWAGAPSTYAGPLNNLKAQGYEVCFVPFVFNPRYAMAASMETVQRFFIDQPHMGGWFNFAADGSLGDVLRSNADARRATLLHNKVFMAGLTPTYNSANLRDWRGMLGYGAAWEGLIRDGADWVEIVTWNDYQEDSNLMPFRWPAGADKRYYVRDESYLDVTAYYSAWFKTGRRPPITQDKLYATYRNRSKLTRQAWDEQAKAWVDITATPFPYDQMHDDVGDSVYLDTFLTAPARLTITLGGREHRYDQPAGVGHARVPIAAGVPRFTLTREGAKTPLIDVIGRKLIIDKPTVQDSPRGKHFVNRTYTSAAVAGPALRLDAKNASLEAGAALVKIGQTHAVANLEQPGSGLTFPLKGLKTGTYNVRITYCNPAPAEARLTLSADGPPRAPKELAHFIPAHLPPTGQDRFATVSFLWSLYDSTTFLRLTWEPSIYFGKPQSEHDDRGVVQVSAIELVRVEPIAAAPAPLPGNPPAKGAGAKSAGGVDASATAAAELPLMVLIPAGKFTMGGPGGEPDELPARDVSISAFEMSLTPVTNRQFERFDPSHRRFRDSYSWRDAEPVIYVSWTDAAKYCNWLSEQAGLTPVYKPKPIEGTNQTYLEADLAADGYRLPTEAQWEYAASGRGEGRRYPWGRDEPDARHGHIGGAASAEGVARLRANPASGVSVVGDFPANASRDGLLDLSGNVCQWCTDWFHPYAADARQDPCNLAKGEHRVVRGGSWGYYNFSQRSADREFQNPNYPGYIYIGFRVVKRARP